MTCPIFMRFVDLTAWGEEASGLWWVRWGHSRSGLTEVNCTFLSAAAYATTDDFGNLVRVP